MKLRLLFILSWTCNSLFSQDNLTLTRSGIKYFLAGDFEKSIHFLTVAIDHDSTAYENYYFRAIARTYTPKDTLSVEDFFKAVRLKTKYSRQADTTFVAGFLAKPARRAPTSTPAFLHEQSETFFDLMLSTWYLLNNDKRSACLLLNGASLKGFAKLEKFRKKYCP
ncbi:MAG: hypothetical protein V4635_16705 [Bacteroidota bacterium]